MDWVGAGNDEYGPPNPWGSPIAPPVSDRPSSEDLTAGQGGRRPAARAIDFALGLALPGILGPGYSAWGLAGGPTIGGAIGGRGPGPAGPFGPQEVPPQEAVLPVTPWEPSAPAFDEEQGGPFIPPPSPAGPFDPAMVNPALDPEQGFPPPDLGVPIQPEEAPPTEPWPSGATTEESPADWWDNWIGDSGITYDDYGY